MSIINELVTNRTPGAAYGWTDMNRVAEAMEYIAARLRANGLDVTVATRRFTREDFPTPAVMEQYLAQLSRLRQALTLWAVTPPVPLVSRGKDYMTVQEANDIEKILVDVDEVLKLMAGSWIRCGSPTAYSAQRGLPTEGGAEPRTWAELDELGWGWAEWDMKTWTQLLYEGV